jgi:hypothetical protein
MITPNLIRDHLFATKDTIHIQASLFHRCKGRRRKKTKCQRDKLVPAATLSKGDQPLMRIPRARIKMVPSLVSPFLFA